MRNLILKFKDFLFPKVRCPRCHSRAEVTVGKMGKTFPTEYYICTRKQCGLAFTGTEIYE